MCVHRTYFKLGLLLSVCLGYFLFTPADLLPAQTEPTTPCLLELSVTPASPASISEGDSLSVIVTACYEDTMGKIKLYADGLPDFSFDWDYTQAICDQCTIIDTVVFKPDYCDNGDYYIRFRVKRLTGTLVADTVEYLLKVKNSNAPCGLDVIDSIAVIAGEEVTFPVTAFDADTACGSVDLSWDYWGEPRDRGGYLTPGTWQREFVWETAAEDIGRHVLYIKVSDGSDYCRDSVIISVNPSGPCEIPVIIPEPPFTRGTSNTICYIPGCGAYYHEICYIDAANPSEILGCRESEWDKLPDIADTLCVVIDGLEDGHRYYYYAKAYFIEGKDSVTRSDTTSSVQDATAPDSVNTLQAVSDSGGIIRLSWMGVNDAVSYVNRYEIYRKTDETDFERIFTVPAIDGNNEETPYDTIDFLGGSTGLEEGLTYYYMARPVDTVGNRGWGLVTNGVIPDSTAPCRPEQRVDFDYRLFIFSAAYARGVENRVWARSNCPGDQTADYIRFQVVRDSAKFFDSEWPTEGLDIFHSGWLAYSGDSLGYPFNFLPPNGDTAFVNGHQYLYRAQARDEVGNVSQWSYLDSAWQDAFPPVDIGNLTVRPLEMDDDEAPMMKVIWEPAIDHLSGLKEYHVYRRIGDDEYSRIAATTDTFYIDTRAGLDVREPVCYRIGSEDNVGNIRDYTQTYWEECVRPHIGPHISLGCTAVIDDQCYTNRDSVAVIWSDYDRENVISLEVVCSACPDSVYFQSDPDRDSLVIPLGPDGEYLIKARAHFNDGAISTWSNEESIVRDATPPDPITDLKAFNSRERCRGYIHLTWGEPYDAIGTACYVIMRSADGETFEEIDEYCGTVLPWPDGTDTLTVYHYYTYQVWPVDLLGNVRENGNNSSAAFSNRPPRVINSSLVDDQIIIRWERALPSLAETWVDSVLVFRNFESIPISAAKVNLTDSFPFPAVEYGSGIYTFQVMELVSVEGDSLTSAWSCPYDVPYDTIPPTALNFVLQPQPMLPGDTLYPVGEMLVAWSYDDIRLIDHFRITRTDPAGNEDTLMVDAVRPGDYYIVDGDLYAGAVYEYCLAAVDRFGQTGESVCASAAIDPLWVYTPKIREDILPFFDGKNIDLFWDWVNSDLVVVDTTYGAVEIQLEVSIFPDFPPEFSITTGWLPVGLENWTIDVNNLISESNLILYRHIRARDSWGRISPWSHVYFGNMPITADNLAPEPIDTIACSTRAVADTVTDYIDVYLSWEKSRDIGNGSGLSHYLVLRDMTDNNWQQLASLGAPDTDFVDLRLSVEAVASEKYRYTIQSVDSIGNIRDNGNYIFHLPLVPIPTNPTALSKDSITWDFPDGMLVDSFYAERSDIPGWLGTYKMGLLPPGKWAGSSAEGLKFDHASYYNDKEIIYYHIKAVWQNYESGWSEVAVFGNDTSGQAPKRYVLHQNNPNPFNPETRIAFGIPQPGHVTLKIFNIRGQLVKTLLDETLSADYHEILWDGTNHHGEQVASGIYFYRLVTDKFTESKKMLLIH